ncbi:MAG: DUF1634 domain-containing protein [Candidatus Aureabacteria bacterium]|nr:DUF1634 domain-containing protein [Candidatus Auribacterota bacterium]
MKNQTGRCEADRPLADRMESLEELISVVLRISVITALIVIVAGVVVSFVRHPDWIGSGNALPALKTGAEGRIHSLSQVGTGLRDYRGRSIIMGGLLFLIMVPVIRVAVSAIIFFRQRDWIYTILTSAVLLGLIISFLLGATG